MPSPTAVVNPPLTFTISPRNKRPRPSRCPSSFIKVFEHYTSAGQRQEKAYLPCGRATCSYCGVKQREERTVEALKHFHALKMYLYVVPLDEWRKLRDIMRGETWLQIPHPNGQERLVFSSVKVPGWTTKYIEQDDRETSILEAFEDIAGRTDLYPRASWGSLRPAPRQGNAGVEMLEGYDDTEVVTVLEQAGYAKKGYRNFKMTVPPKIICHLMPVRVWPTNEWRARNPGWDTALPTADDWVKLSRAWIAAEAKVGAAA